MKKQKTFYPKPSDTDQSWHLIDADSQIVGRIASEVASIVNGKRNKLSTPGFCAGQFVVIINANKVILTGKKEEQKKYYRHSGYIGGLKVKTYKELMKTKPEDILIKAITGMLPHNKYGKSLASHIKVYTGDKHPHEAQNPIEYKMPNKKGAKV